MRTQEKAAEIEPTEDPHRARGFDFALYLLIPLFIVFLIVVCFVAAGFAGHGG